MDVISQHKYKHIGRNECICIGMFTVSISSEMECRQLSGLFCNGIQQFQLGGPKLAKEPTEFSETSGVCFNAILSLEVRVHTLQFSNQPLSCLVIVRKEHVLAWNSISRIITYA